MSGASQEHQNRKLLEQLHEKKKRLQHGHHTSSGPSLPMPQGSQILTNNAPPANTGIMLSETEYATIANPQQRQALKHAHSNSVGYFITQDSAFGNLILPVLPRVTDGKMETK